MQYTEIDNNQTNILASSKKTKLYRSNEIIYKKQEKIINIFIILDGIVESSSSDQCKKNKFTLHKGSSLGLIDAILKRPFSRNMLAKSTVSLAIIEKSTLENILGNEEIDIEKQRIIIING